jgi:hypothetical protein
MTDELKKIDVKEIVIGQWATYMDTGIWTLINGEMIAPEDITVEQIKDMLLVSGGAVYLNKDRKLAWTPPAIPKGEWIPGAACS